MTLIFFSGLFIGITISIMSSMFVKLPKRYINNMRNVDSKPEIFTEDVFFVDPKDVVESYKQSSNVAEFINKIK
jgi:hypothetical protein